MFWYFCFSKPLRAARSPNSKFLFAPATAFTHLIRFERVHICGEFLIKHDTFPSSGNTHESRGLSKQIVPTFSIVWTILVDESCVWVCAEPNALWLSDFVVPESNRWTANDKTDARITQNEEKDSKSYSFVMMNYDDVPFCYSFFH